MSVGSKVARSKVIKPTYTAVHRPIAGQRLVWRIISGTMSMREDLPVLSSSCPFPLTNCHCSSSHFRPLHCFQNPHHDEKAKNLVSHFFSLSINIFFTDFSLSKEYLNLPTTIRTPVTRQIPRAMGAILSGCRESTREINCSIRPRYPNRPVEGFKVPDLASSKGFRFLYSTCIES